MSSANQNDILNSGSNADDTNRVPAPDQQGTRETAKPSNELLYFTTLKRITCYHSPESLKRVCEREYGLPYEEALEMAYENILADARFAVHGKRVPKK